MPRHPDGVLHNPITSGVHGSATFLQPSDVSREIPAPVSNTKPQPFGNTAAGRVFSNLSVETLILHGFQDPESSIQGRLHWTTLWSGMHKYLRVERNRQRQEEHTTVPYVQIGHLGRLRYSKPDCRLLIMKSKQTLALCGTRSLFGNHDEGTSTHWRGSPLNSNHTTRWLVQLAGCVAGWLLACLTACLFACLTGWSPAWLPDWLAVWLSA